MGRLKHISLSKRHESIFIGDRRDAGDAPLILVQEPSLGERLTLFVAVPRLQVVNDRDVVNVLSISTQELMPSELTFTKTLALQVSVQRFPARYSVPGARRDQRIVAVKKAFFVFFFLLLKRL